MDIDIMQALEATPTRGTERCELMEFLYGIPADTPGRDELIRLVETPHDRNSGTTRSGANMARVLTSLGFSITQNPIHDHRNHNCRCYR